EVVGDGAREREHLVVGGLGGRGLGDLLGPAARQVVEVLTALDPLRGASVAVPCREAVGPLGLPAADADLRAGLRAGDVLEMGEHRAPVAAAPVLRVYLDAEPGVVEVVVVRGPDARERDRFAAVQTDQNRPGSPSQPCVIAHRSWRAVRGSFHGSSEATTAARKDDSSSTRSSSGRSTSMSMREGCSCADPTAQLISVSATGAAAACP